MAQHTNEEKMEIVFSEVLRIVRERAEQCLPVRGKFSKFGIGFRFPDDLYGGFLIIDFGDGPEKRVANISVHPIDSDRAVTNYVFFDSYREVIEWLGAGESVTELIQIVQHLREKAEHMD